MERQIKQTHGFFGGRVDLHISTLFIIIIVTCITLAGSALAASARRAGDGLREWGLALCVHAIGYLLLALRDVIPDALSIVIANALFSVSHSIFYYALRIFLGLRPTRRLFLWGPPCLMICGLLYVLEVPEYRVLLVNCILLLQSLLVLNELLGYNYDFPVRGRNQMVVGIVLIMTMLTWKACASVLTPAQIMHIFQPSPVHMALYLTTLISLIMISNGFVLMAKERSDAYLRQAAMLDKLTGCWNRIRIEEILQQELARLRRYGHPAVILMLDLDKFKRINDQFGHLAGDEALRDFGRLLRTHIRATDVPGRWGGEEFMVVLPSSTFFDAVTLAEHIREHLEKLRFSFGGTITASIGVAACRPTDTMEEWIRRADLALYRAKTGGRNQVKVEDLDSSIDNFICSASNALRLQWSETYECGHADIDQQHRHLFETVNTLLQLNSSGADKTRTAEAIQGLLTETIEHFQFEEHILEQIGYPEAPSHIQAHQRLLDRANILLAQFLRNGTDLAALLHFMIYELTAQHIMIDDRCFGKISTPLSETGIPADNTPPDEEYRQ